MKSKIVFLFVLFASAALCSINCQKQMSELPSGPRIRDIIQEKFPGKNFLIGATIGVNDFDSVASDIINREYNYVTPENDFKHSTIRRESSSWNWNAPDSWLARIEANDQVLRMHCPIDRQHACWTENAPVSQLQTEVNEWYKKICERYGNNPRIQWMDVCNEIVLYDGTWRDETHELPNPFFKLGRENNSTQMPSFVVQAIKLCRQYAPDLKLIWNQDGEIIFDEQWDTIKSSIEYLESIGCGIDGIGWQAHVGQPHEDKTTADYKAYLSNPGTNKKLKELIAWCHARDMEFHISETDFYLPETESTPTEKEMEDQAKAYAEMVHVLLEGSKTGPVYMNMWSATDDTSWKSERHPAIFHGDGTAKPAYYAIQEVLRNWK